jgi:hypothetical protein
VIEQLAARERFLQSDYYHEFMEARIRISVKKSQPPVLVSDVSFNRAYRDARRKQGAFGADDGTTGRAPSGAKSLL